MDSKPSFETVLLLISTLKKSHNSVYAIYTMLTINREVDRYQAHRFDVIAMYMKILNGKDLFSLECYNAALK